MRCLKYVFQNWLIPTILAHILYNKINIFKYILRSPLSSYTKRSFSRGKDVSISIMGIPHSAVCRADVASLFFEDQVSLIHPWVLKNPNGPGKICIGIIYSRCQMQSQCSTSPQLTKLLPPTYRKYCQIQQPDCHEQILEHRKMQLELNHWDKSRIRT